MTWSSAASAEDPPPPDPAMMAYGSQATSSMGTPRWLHSAVRLADGRVLVAGGVPGETASTTAEIYDPATGLWTPTPPMIYFHDWPIVASLCDGRVFVAGHRDANTREAEIYDPGANMWIDAGDMVFSHIYGTATLLSDCRLLLAGGYSGNRFGEIYNPMTGAFKPVPGLMTSERFFHTSTLLADGRVLVAGGGVDINGTWATYPTTDIYDPASGGWTKSKKLHNARRTHTAILLPDGQVLVAGGNTGGKDDGTQAGTPLASAELYDPATDTWAELESKLVTPRAFHTAALMPSGAVLLFGGLDASGSASRQVEGYFNGTWEALDPLLTDRFQHASATLADGSVLVVGGVHQATAEIYRLAPNGEACASGLVCGSGHCVSGICCDEACDTGCRRCDVPGKEGICSRPCADATHALVCNDGSETCAASACAEQACGSYRCGVEAGACVTKCKSVEDCAPGYACDLEGKCVPPPDVSSTDAGSCSATPLDRGWGAGLAAIGGAIALLRRRSRRRASH